MPSLHQPSRVLVYRTGHLGDTVCAIPAFRLVRQHFPEAELTLLCDRPQGGKVATAEVVEPLKLFDRVIAYRSGRRWRTAWELGRMVRKAKPDAVIMLPGVRETLGDVRMKAMLLRVFGRCEVRAVRPMETPGDWRKNEPARLIELLHQGGIAGEKPEYGIPVDPVAQAAVRVKLAAMHVDPAGPFLVFCGGGKAPTQRWPLERYAEVLAAVPWPVVAVGSAGEMEAVRAQILPRFPALRLPAEVLSIPELFEMLRAAGAYLGNDTGPMHAAAAVGCPVAVVMSARNAPGTWDPDIEPRLVIRHRTECEDCFLHECIEQRHRCMTAITSQEVLASLLPFLQSLPVRMHSPNVD